MWGARWGPGLRGRGRDEYGGSHERSVPTFYQSQRDWSPLWTVFCRVCLWFTVDDEGGHGTIVWFGWLCSGQEFLVI